MQTITYKGEEYALEFNLNVMEEIQDEYGSIDAWSELFDTENMSAKALKFGIMAMLNEGIDIYNEEHEEKRPFFTSKQVGRVLAEVGLQEIAESVKNSVVDATDDGEKNA